MKISNSLRRLSHVFCRLAGKIFAYKSIDTCTDSRYRVFKPIIYSRHKNFEFESTRVRQESSYFFGKAAAMDKFAMMNKNSRRLFGPMQPLLKPTKGQASIKKKYRVFTLREVLLQHCKELQKKYRFSLAEISVLIQIFWKLSDRKMFLTNEVYKNFMHLTFNYNVNQNYHLRGYERLVSPFHMKLPEFVRIFWTMLRGSFEDKARLTFEMYDKDGRGTISVENLTTFIKDIAPENEEDIVQDEEEYVYYLDFFLRSVAKERLMGITYECYLNFVKQNSHFMECFYPVWPEEDYIKVLRKLLLR